MAQRSKSVRTEDGALFNTAGQLFQTTRWEYVRLEGGEDLLVGPQALSVNQTVVARLGPGDVDQLQTGTAS